MDLQVCLVAVRVGADGIGGASRSGNGDSEGLK